MMDRRIHSLSLLRPNLHDDHTFHYRNLDSTLLGQVLLDIVYVVL